ncbi:hypothetical protein ACWFRF_04995 [Nocardia sp. NPDC055165]|uniref:hypothetical protein n=1 Tax=Nocardia sp. NPDC060220 TaxID=3347076 RepID=UPI00364D8BA0
MTVESVVQLRVHGVSGTPPEAMLHYPAELIDRVSGDSLAGTYRRRDNSATDAATDPSRNVEAYSWGALTSGKASRGLWLMFMPFILINLAHWMVPPAKAGSRTTTTAAGASVRLLRLIGLTLTLTLMLASVLLAVDLVGWQCAAMPRCGAGLGPLRFLVDRSVGMRLFWTSLPVAALVGLLLWFGRGNPAAGGAPPPAAEVRSDAVPLEDSHFWKPDASVTRLRRCHVTVWLSGLACVVLLGARSQVDADVRRPLTCLLVLNAAIFVLAALAVFSSRVTGRGGKGAPPAVGVTLRVLQWLSVVALTVALVVVGRASVEYDVAQPMSLPYLYSAIYLLLAVQVALIASLFISTAVSRWWPAPPPAAPTDASETTVKGFRPTLWGFASFFVAGIAWLVGGGFSAGVGLFLAQFLGNPVSSTVRAQCETQIVDDLVAGKTNLPAVCEGLSHSKWPSSVGFEDQVQATSADAALIIPPAYIWAAIIFFGLLLMLLFIVVVVRVKILEPRTAAALKEVPKDYNLPPAEPEKAKGRQARARAIAEKRAFASMADLLPTILAVMTGLALLAFAAVLVMFCVDGEAALQRTLPGTTVAVALFSGAAAGLVGLALMAYRNRQARRTVGIIWDVATFWPRANHPLTPPCYAERAVPELRLQLCQHMAASVTQRVIAATHSQGAVIGAATMLQLPENVRQRIALLTFGSPLRRLYARNFPAYFGLRAMTRLHTVQPRWINIWVFSDPIGGWIFNDTNASLAAAIQLVDYRIPDAETLDTGPRDQKPAICAHSGFADRTEYQDVIRALHNQLVEPDNQLVEPDD